ncbi:MAG: hypothetical protein H0T71_14335 [Acidobacteria bacterium]|nr:hypothetical protein [Acidobacteriota bacterium]
MLITALALIAAGVLIAASAWAPWPFDFAVAVMPGWHATVFPPPAFVGVLVILSGIVALLASFLWR